MNIEGIRERRQHLVDLYGPWSSHNIQLVDDCYTISADDVSYETKMVRSMQWIRDISGRPLECLRVLDLACLEGMWAIELASHGATVVGIEGREANIAKARLARDVHGLDNLELIKDDVRNLSVERHGLFDVVLCMGILYHLDAPDIFEFVSAISSVCKRLAIIDTHVSLAPKEPRTYMGHTYWGRVYTEFSVRSTTQEKESAVWSSLDNIQSFWLTHASLNNLLARVGFSSVCQGLIPYLRSMQSDRVELVALKGERHRFRVAPQLNSHPSEYLPEEPDRRVDPSQADESL
ncbi:MAG: class I SAM-dependent methyltransferase [Planctomycetota bacterium]